MHSTSNIRIDQSDIYQTEKNDKLRTKQEQNDKVSFFQLFRFAQIYQYVLLFLGVIFAMVAGCSFPCLALIMGKILDSFLYIDADKRLDNATYYRNIFFYIGIGALFSAWVAFVAWTMLSQRLTIKCRKAYMKSLLQQDIGWYDQQNQFQLSSQFSKDAESFQKATGQKIGSMFILLAMFICGGGIAIGFRWTMAIVILAALPIIGFGCIIFIYLIQRKNSQFQNLYEKADSCAHQAINSIKTVKSLNGQIFEENRYNNFLNLLKQKVLKWSLLAGFGTGLFFFIQYCTFSFGFWYGTNCVAGTQKCSPSVTGSVYTPGETAIVFYGIFVGSFNFMQLVPNITSIIQGMKAAKRLYKIIDLQPIIKKNNKGIQLQKIKGQFVFKNVSFAYPKDKNTKILNQINLEINAGTINAFVGDSGCGKSTILQLLMRFYDPDEGIITLDGRDLKQYDLQWLRSCIGYVGQQPCLFEGTVIHNILIGSPKATLQQVNQALAKAQASQFINNLPQKLNYNVGYGGSRLSGGQKQRIAIARAILRKPQILILDEATSALDRRNQKLIQSTLDKLTNGVTTLTVAHRVKTIMNANKIFVLEKGKVAEQGKFTELERFNGYELQIDQQIVKEINPVSQKIPQQKFINDLNSSKVVTQNKDYSIFGRLFSYTKGRRCMLFVAIIACIVSGAAHPAAALLLANNFNQQFNIYAYSVSDIKAPQISGFLKDAEWYVLGNFLVAVFIFFPFMIQSTLFSIIGEQVTQKIRKQVYYKMLRFPVGWFQKQNNRGGAAANRFGIGSRQVNSLVTSMISTLVMNFSSIIVGIVLAFVYERRLGLVGLVAMPCIVGAGFISMLFYGGFGDSNKIYYEQSSKLSEEAILNIRTIYSCGYESRLGQIYDEKLKYPQDAAFAKGSKIGLLYGFSQLLLNFTFGLIFYFGALIMKADPNVNLLNIFCCNMTIIWAGWYSGNNFYFMPDVQQGKNSAKQLFQILDTPDEDQIQISQSSKMLKNPILGHIQLKNVSFNYSSQTTTISNLNIKINKGQKVAFVGPSGCGKSTIMQLLQRFYDCNGLIQIDGINIKDYDIHHLRSYLAIVNQQPSLFTGTLKDNVIYNKKASQQEFLECIKNAQALKIIEESKDRQNRDIGVLGSQLSGGQKQRIAIARALLRKPQILLLDQATSAIDSGTERKVQANIDAAMKGKTCLVIAHRLQTIQDSSKIYMFDRGQIIQNGSYSELMANKKYFYNLKRGQKLHKE